MMLLLLVLLVQLSFAAPKTDPPTAPPTNAPTQGPGFCPNFGSCTSKDVTTTVVAVAEADRPFCSTKSGTASGKARLSFLATATQRYDIGLFSSNDGAAITSTSNNCNREYVPVTPGENFDGDTCGDVGNDVPVAFDFTVSVDCSQVTATAGTTAGSYSLPNVRVWTQSDTSICTGAATLPVAGTGSKCQDGPLSIQVKVGKCFEDPCTATDCDPLCTDNTNNKRECVEDSAATNGYRCVCNYNSNVKCRNATTECDEPENCADTDTDFPYCPTDQFKPASTECNQVAVANKCYTQYCNGGSDVCETLKVNRANWAAICADGVDCTVDVCQPDFGSVTLTVGTLSPDCAGCDNYFQEGSYKNALSGYTPHTCAKRNKF